MTCADAARLGHNKRREIFRAKAREMCLAMGSPIPPALNPPLVLGPGDRL